ncbi:A/G-specific adenine glycosylase [Chelatococcus sambhunathii]|uniref:Adenine DNA glycosylase n=1 Tax=Chelatococcus sambhunathii TaxID=363953 RepID=A0ABU1DI98_9HYPH|nr:A/G-specific adenine glycosylase [Chelatococcus sambhunathii]MDR4307859.1 A/G-specific adenine glycosylase [Chelatococcus sambhunathii]
MALPVAPDPTALLAWYNRHRRKLPWRAERGASAEPYRVWLSEIMLQQTTVKAAGPYFLRFLQRFPDIQSLAAASLDEVLKLWAGLGYYSRARNLHACAKAVLERHGGRFPDSEAALLALPGVGPYTAAAIAAIAFDRPATVVDGNVERVVSRLFALEAPLPGAKPEIRRLAATLAPVSRHGDFAQAMMDLGATICTPRKPACALCPWSDACLARSQGAPETYPRKTPKTARPTRYGVAFVAERADGAILLRDRPAKGLLGGMAETPTGRWSEDVDLSAPLAALAAEAPLAAAWRRTPGVATHVFTHFVLELAVLVASAPAGSQAPSGARWVPVERLGEEALPTVFRKALAHALGDRLRPRAPPT